MTEVSRPWEGTATGDAGNYDSTEWARVWRKPFGGPIPTNTGGVVLLDNTGEGQGLVTGTVSPVAVAALSAFVDGRWYESDASVNVAIPTPVANPRVDRIVLRRTLATQEVRITRVAGTEAAIPTPPALTQTAATWDISLAQVYITTGGTITVRDERVNSMGLGPAVLFRDIYGRVAEEFFDHLGALGPSNANGSDWVDTSTSGTVSRISGRSAFQLTSTATNGRTAGIAYGNDSNGFSGAVAAYRYTLDRGPTLFEGYMTPLNAAADGQTTAVLRLANSGNTQMIEFGVIGATSTTNLVLRGTNGGTTAFNTGVAINTSGAYHRMGILVNAAATLAIALYDGVPIGQITANLPDNTTALRPEFIAGNGTTAAARIINVDWARLLRSAAA